MPFGPIIRALRHNKTRFVLIVLEIAITLAIVTNCVNMILDERRQMLQASRASTTTTSSASAAGPSRRVQGCQRYASPRCNKDLRALQSVPGVAAAANTNFLPWQGGGSSST